MTKKELIQIIKNEIKTISSALKENKKAFRKHQSNISKGLPSDFDGYKKYETLFSKYLVGISSAKCHLTCLHIEYNKLRNGKQHCHTLERNQYYVEWFKATFERMESELEEEQDANISCTTLA